MPRHDIKWRVIDLCFKELSAPFNSNRTCSKFILKSSNGGFKVTRIRQTVRPDWPPIRQGKFPPVVLAHISARRGAGQFNSKLHPTRNNADLSRRDIDLAKLCKEAERALLWHYQKLTICVVKVLILHRCVNKEEARRHAGLSINIPRRSHRANAGDKGCFLSRR